MSDEKKNLDESRLRRISVVVRSWDGPNSRVGFELDLNEMPWGPFDALGKKLHLLLPAYSEFESSGTGRESEIAKALRHVEHAADRCGEFAQTSGSSREMWLNSQRTWEWVRRYLTHLWVQEEVEGDAAELARSIQGAVSEAKAEEPLGEDQPESDGGPEAASVQEIDLPSLPGAAAILKAAVLALKTTPLSSWRETVEATDPEAPTREEAIQTLLGVAKILEGRGGPQDLVFEVEGPGEVTALPEEETPAPKPDEPDFEQVTLDFAEGYDQGYQMGRKVGWALGSSRRKKEDRDPR